MGRPLNKRNFLNAGILVRVNGNADAVIIKQTGSKRFVCADADSGAGSEECVLVSKLAPAAGECSIVLEDNTTDIASIFVTKISGRKLTASDGNTYTWSVDAKVDGSGHYNLVTE